MACWSLGNCRKSLKHDSNQLILIVDPEKLQSQLAEVQESLPEETPEEAIEEAIEETMKETVEETMRETMNEAMLFLPRTVEGRITKIQSSGAKTLEIERYGRLTQKEFQYFKSSLSETFGSKPIQSIPLSDIEDLTPDEKQLQFEVKVAGNEHCEPTTPEKTTKLLVPNKMLKAKSIESINPKNGNNSWTKRASNQGLVFKVNTLKELKNWLTAFKANK